MSVKILDMRDRTRPHLHLEALVKNEDGKKEIRQYEPPFKPYAYMREQDLPLHIDKLKGTYTIGDDAPDGFVKLEADDPYHIRQLKWSDDFDFETFESDVPYVRRINIDHGTGFDIPDEEDILFFDIEVDSRGDFPEAEDAERQVISISAIDGVGTKHFFCYDDEKRLLQEFVDLLDDYFVLAGWNSEKFDLPYIQNRCKQFGIYYDWFEIVHTDMMTLYRDILPNDIDSYKLDNVGEHEFDMGKEDQGVDPYKHLWDWFQNDREKLREYNEGDTTITRKVHKRYAAVQFAFRMARKSHTRASQLIYIDNGGNSRLAVGKCCDSVILSIAHEDGIVLPDKGRFQETHDFPGGHVFAPDAGLHHDVITADFSGMYPSIVKTWNIGPNTWIDEPDPVGDVNKGVQHLVEDGCTEIFADSGEMQARGHFKKETEEKSVLAKAIEKLEGQRNSAKAKMKSATRGTREWKKWFSLDGSWKAMINSFYGICASPYHRYFQPGMSEHITEGGQILIGETKRFAEEEHPDVDYIVTGDTDSVIMALKAKGRDTVEVAKGVASSINQHIKDMAQRVCDVDPELLKVDLDEVFSDFIITAKKKKYAGYVIYDEGPCFDLKIKGFECIKSNWPWSIRNFQKSLIIKLLDDEPYRDLIEEARHELFSGQLDEELITRKGLGSEPEDYSGTPPIHARAAMDIRDRKGRGAVRQGDKIPYISYGDDTSEYCECEDGIAVDFRPNEHYCEDCDEVVRGDHDHETLDAPHFRDTHYSYMWSHKFEKIMTRLGVGMTEQTGLDKWA